MDSLLRDLNREQQKMRTDVDNLFHHYDKLQDYLYQYVKQSVMEWAKLIVTHPQASLLIVETTLITDERGYHIYGNQNEPIRFTTLQLVTGEVFDQLLRPKHSQAITGTEYHGLTMEDVADKPMIDDVWPEIQQHLENRHIVIFNAEYARLALQPAYSTRILDNAFCLHNKAKEFYNQFYELSLEKVLSYQNIEKRREELKDSRDRILILSQVLHNLAAGMEKPPEESYQDDSLDNLDEHPF